MLTARDEMIHIASTLTEEEAEKVIEVLHRELPELFGEAKDEA